MSGESSCVQDGLQLDLVPIKGKGRFFVKSKELMEANYPSQINLAAFRIMALFLTRINSGGEIPDRFFVSRHLFAETYGVSLNHADKLLRSGIESLFSSYLEIKSFSDQDKKKLDSIIKVRYVSGFKFNREKGLFVTLSHPMLPYLSNLRTRFTKIDFNVFKQFKTFFEMRIYELVVHNFSFGSGVVFGKVYFSLDELRGFLGTTSSQYCTKNQRFFDRCVEPALNGIGKVSGKKYKVEKVFSRRRFVGINIFDMSTKDREVLRISS